MIRTLRLLALILVIPAPAAMAEVTDRGPNGFTVKVVADVAAPPETAYAALAGHVGEWWDGAHTYSGDARNMSIAAKAGGCFCEVLPDSGSIEHAVVVLAQPGRMLRMRGAFGPLQEAGIAGSLSFQFDKAATGTRLTLTYVAGGYYPGGFDKLAPLVDSVFAQQLKRLADYVDRTAKR